MSTERDALTECLYMRRAGFAVGVVLLAVGFGGYFLIDLVVGDVPDWLMPLAMVAFTGAAVVSLRRIQRGFRERS